MTSFVENHKNVRYCFLPNNGRNGVFAQVTENDFVCGEEKTVFFSNIIKLDIFGLEI